MQSFFFLSRQQKTTGVACLFIRSPDTCVQHFSDIITVSFLFALEDKALAEELSKAKTVFATQRLCFSEKRNLISLVRSNGTAENIFGWLYTKQLQARHTHENMKTPTSIEQI